MLIAGRAGAIVIKGRLDHTQRLRHTEEHLVVLHTEEHLVVLKDLTLARGVPGAHNFFDWWNGKEGELVLVSRCSGGGCWTAIGPIALTCSARPSRSAG